MLFLLFTAAGTVSVTADDDYNLFVDGVEIGVDNDPYSVETYDLLSRPRVIAVNGLNYVSYCVPNDRLT